LSDSTRDEYNNFIDIITHEFSSKSIALFVGAGISRGAGLPLANEIKDEIFQDICTPYLSTNIHPPDEKIHSIMLELLLQVINDYIGNSINDISAIFSSQQPIKNHLFIARMAKRGLLKYIFTTNFDSLIEIALDVEGVSYYQVFDEETFNLATNGDDIPWVIKLHGTIPYKSAKSADSMILTLNQVGKSLDRWKQIIIKKVLNEKSVLFMGWSDNDIDLTPRLIEGSRPFYWVVHSNSQATCQDLNDLSDVNKPIKEMIIAHNGVGKKIDTSRFIDSLWSFYDG
jgi:NAD-dependent SIR2 family protein deacetylase